MMMERGRRTVLCQYVGFIIGTEHQFLVPVRTGIDRFVLVHSSAFNRLKISLLRFLFIFVPENLCHHPLTVV